MDGGCQAVWEDRDQGFFDALNVPFGWIASKSVTSPLSFFTNWMANPVNVLNEN